MKITFLGTAAAEAIPSPFCDCSVCEHARSNGGKNMRRRQSALINDELLIDFGPDVISSCGTFGISLIRVNTLLVTHSHSDHFVPTELNMRAKPFRLATELPELTMVAGPSVWAKWDQAGSDAHAGIRRVPILPGRSVEVNGYRVRAIEATHNSRIGDAMNYLIDDGRTKLLYASDTGLYADHVWEELRDAALDGVVLEGTSWRVAPGKEHLNESDFAQMLASLRRIGAVDERTAVIASHFSHQGVFPHDELEAKVRKHGAICAYDGLTVEI
jgi:phosphoribosyl 1,2-cyclic phosphate phosphodiesterase